MADRQPLASPGWNPPPPTAPPPVGRVIVHRGRYPLDARICFWAWTQPPADDLAPCTCGYAPDAGPHYRRTLIRPSTP